MAHNLEAEIKKMVSEITEIPAEKLKNDADLFKELGIDSMKAIEIVAAFEKKYRIVIPEQEIPKIRTIKQIIEYTKVQNK